MTFAPTSESPYRAVLFHHAEPDSETPNLENP